jgi:hypothetical protein
MRILFLIADLFQRINSITMMEFKDPLTHKNIIK